MRSSARNAARRAGKAAALSGDSTASYSWRGGVPMRPVARALRRVWLAAYERAIRRQPGDPVLAAIRNAPQASPEERERYYRLRAEVTSDPKTWTYTFAELLAGHGNGERVKS